MERLKFQEIVEISKDNPIITFKKLEYNMFSPYQGFIYKINKEYKVDKFNLVGHIHGLWRVQRNMINVSVDAWGYKPISVETILTTKNAIEQFYDGNVFAGELDCNTQHIIKDKEVLYPIEFKDPSVKSIFLAGPIMGALNWRKNFIYLLNILTIFNIL